MTEWDPLQMGTRHCWEPGTIPSTDGNHVQLGTMYSWGPCRIGDHLRVKRNVIKVLGERETTFYLLSLLWDCFHRKNLGFISFVYFEIYYNCGNSCVSVQDWMSLVGYDHPELFHVLPCAFNLQDHPVLGTSCPGPAMINHHHGQII
jgi:hypothetical protein